MVDTGWLLIRRESVVHDQKTRDRTADADQYDMKSPEGWGDGAQHLKSSTGSDDEQGDLIGGWHRFYSAMTTVGHLFA